MLSIINKMRKVYSKYCLKKYGILVFFLAVFISLFVTTINNIRNGYKEGHDEKPFHDDYFNGIIHRTLNNQGFKLNRSKSVPVLQTSAGKTKAMFNIVAEYTNENISQIQNNHTKPRTGQCFMTIYPPRGQFGNQMFQIASLLGIAQENNFVPFLPLFGFNLNTIFEFPIQFYKSIPISNFTKYTEYSTTKFINLENITISTNFVLDGYFQVHRYFKDRRMQIRNYFKFRPDFIKSARQFLKQNAHEQSVTVGIHVRRGDYMNQKEQKLGRNFPGIGYIYRAMDYFKQKPMHRFRRVTFVVISDDMSWCRANINSSYVINATSHMIPDHSHVIYSPYKHAGYDLALMSLTGHIVITVGTFGWWGGHLNTGTVVYYSGYPTPGSYLDKHFVKADYYPPNWIGLE